MNHFTKGELIEMRQSMRATAFQRYIHGMSHEQNNKLIEKIQTIIENYCEHKNIACYSEVDYVYFCKDCWAVTGAN